MNIVSKVTWMYMKKNRKRTLVTIFGVIISVAMITAVLISIESFMDMFLRREMASSGSWIAEYRDVNKEQLEMLKNNNAIGTVMLRDELGYSLLEDSEDSNKKYLYIEEADTRAMEDMHLEVVSGRLPQKNGEIVLDQALLSNVGNRYAVGDTLELVLGHREMEVDGQILIYDQSAGYQGGSGNEETFVPDGETKTYTVVGFIKTPAEVYSWAAGYTCIAFLDDASLGDEACVNARILLNDVDSNAYETISEIAQSGAISEYRIHESLLKYYGVTEDDGMNLFLKTIAGFLIAIIMVGSVMLIYNAFAISLSERSRQLGMLSSVGATRAQKRRSVFFEGGVIGCLSIPLGLLAGFGGMAVTFKVIEPMVNRVMGEDVNIRCTVKGSTIVAAIILAAVTIFISSWIPAARASKITPIDSIRQNKDIKLSRRQVKTSRLTRRLFGFEGELALKNLKRNKKSYRITIISLVLSFALFLSVAGYVTMLQKAYGIADNTSDYDVYTVCSDNSREKISLLTSLEEVEQYNVITRGYVEAYFNSDDFDRVITSDYKKLLSDSSAADRVGVSFRGMPKDKLIEFMESIGMDASAISSFDGDSPQSIPVILINRYNMVTGNYQWADMTVAEPSSGENLSMDGYTYDNDGNYVEIQGFMNMYIVGVTDQFPMGMRGSDGFYPGMNIFAVTLDTYLEELGQAVSETYGQGVSQKFIYMKSSDPEALTEAVKEICDDDMYYYSVWETEQSDRALMTMLQVFCYGFIGLMTLICTANILNTVSTGIDLRRREFAMLKSVGMTPGAFNRMLVFESLFYGIKTLLYGIPIGLAVIVWEYRMMSRQFAFKFALPVPYFIAAVLVLIVVVSVSMAYSFGKVRKENILDGLRTE